MYRILVSGNGGGDAVTLALYTLDLDAQSIHREAAAALKSSPFLCAHGRDIYAAAEDADGNGMILSFKLDDDFIRTGAVALNAPALCHVSYGAPLGQVFGASYRSGDIYSCSLNEDGSPDGMVFAQKQVGEEPGRLTRAHFIMPDPGCRYVYAVNISLDRIYCYNCGETGILTQNGEMPYLELPPGEGPRHFAFAPRRDIMYVVTEYSNKVWVLHVNPRTGTLAVREQVSILPEGFEGKTTGSSICVVGDRLYAATRGADSIAVFSVDENGDIIKLADCPCGGSVPRHIHPTDDGRFMLAANQNSGRVDILPIDARDGLLGASVLSIPFDAPTFVLDYSNY